MKKNMQQLGSETGHMNSYDWQSWAIYTALSAISILIPLGISYIGGLELPTELIASIVFIFNSILVLIKKITQDRAYILKKLQ